MSTLLSLTLRPLRLAVIADCRSAEGLLRAITATTMQWGGSANPLIPYFDAYPAALSEGFDRIDSFEKAYEAIARYHDPDRVLSVVDAPLSFSIEAVALDPVLKENPDIVWDNPVGIGLLEIARAFYHEHLRFVARQPAQVACVEAGEELTLSAAVLYGALAPSARDTFLEIMGGVIAPTIVNAKDFYEPFFQGYVTPRLVGQHYLSFSGYLAVGCIHETEPLDVLTIWNAAADHRHLIPLPLGSDLSAQLLERLVSHLSKAGPPGIVIIRSPSVSNDELELVFRAFNNANIRPILHDYLRVAPTKFERSNSTYCTARRALRSLEEQDERIDIELLGPRLRGRDSLRYGDPRYVNEVSIKAHDRKRLPAEVLPAGLKRFWSRRFPPLIDFRVADTGLCLFAKRTDERESVPLPDATTIVRAFLEDRGFKTSVSSQGLAFQQLLMLTNGATSSLNHPKVRAILQLFDSASDREGDREDAVRRVLTWGEIQHAVPDHPERSLKILLEARLMAAGVILQCDNCNGRELYVTSEIEAVTRCKRCQLAFSPPFDFPRAMDTWAYRLLPPFDNGDMRRALLGMSFALSVLTDSPGDKTVAAGINLTYPGPAEVNIEVDLIALQQPAYDRPEVVPLFLEAKYRQMFTRLDVARMALLLQVFPYGIFGFSTVRDIADFEPHVLRRLRAFSRIRQNRREPTHTTMLLTQRELRPSFESIGDHDHIAGFLREIGLKTTERYFTAAPRSYVAWRTEREAAKEVKREREVAKTAARARAIKAALCSRLAP